MATGMERKRSDTDHTADAAVTRDASRAMEHTQASLGDLAAAARLGDRAAAEILMERIRTMALRYARARLGHSDAAQDVAQEVCMAILTALPSYEDRGLPFEAFVFGIAARKVADALRAVMRQPVPVAEIPEDQSTDPGPEDSAVTADQVTTVLHLLKTLPEQQREILTLRVAVGLSTQETAAALEMTEGAIRVAQHRALAKLRTMLAHGEAGDVA